MPRKIANRIVRVTRYTQQYPDFTKLATESLSAPQKETEKVVIPEGGEVQLQNPNVLPDSLDISELKTHEEFARSEDQTFGKSHFFVLENTVFFSPEDVGRRVKIDYLWLEAPPDDEDEESEAEGEDDEDGDEESPKAAPKRPMESKESLWHLNEAWFKWKPLVKEVSVNNSLRAKLEKGVDLTQGLKVTNSKTGKELRTKLTSLKNEKPTNLPGPGEVAYSYADGFLHFGDASASGNTYRVEYFIPGKNTKKLTLEKDPKAEYQAVEGLKARAQNLWTAILDHPNPAFVSETIVPLIEDEVAELEESKSDSSNLPDASDFMKLEHLLAKREADDSPDNRSLARDFVEAELAPKLGRLYPLASLISERVYEMQSEAQDEDFPEFGEAGGRSLDRPTLQYIKKVRQGANELDREIVDFSKYYTGLLNKWILDGASYFSGKPVPFRAVRDVFEKAGVGIADLQTVALDAFRQAILEFDRDKRNKQETPDPKDFRVFAAPTVYRRVTNALKSVFDKYKREQQVENVSRAGVSSITIPEDGGLVELVSGGERVTGFRLEDLKVQDSAGHDFTSARGIAFKTRLPKNKEGQVENKSKHVLIPLKKAHPTAQISVTDPETGVKLNRVEGKWSVETKAKVAKDPNSFLFATSSGNIWFSRENLDKTFLIEAPGLESQSVVGKNQYRANPFGGTLEFSPQNGGDTVTVRYTQTIRSKRFVSPSAPGSDSEEGEEALSPMDLAAQEGADPESIAEQALAQENIDKLLDVVGEVLTVEDDPRLNEEERTILEGIMGVGAEGKRLSIQEIAARPPFSYSKEDPKVYKSQMNALKVKQEKAQNTLVEILKEKAETDKGLSRMLNPFSAVLLGKGEKGLAQDKFLSYLNQASEENAAGFQHVLNGLLGANRSKFPQDEENILRWMWAIPGNLRRDQDDEDKSHDILPEGQRPASSLGARLQEIAADEFGVEVDEDGQIAPEAMAVIRKVYERALKKFETAFDADLEKRKSFYESKYPDFVAYNTKHVGKSSFRDELSAMERNEALTPKKPRVEPPKVPLFQQIQKSFPKADPELLKALMTELESTAKSGGSIHDLVNQRQKDVDRVAEKGVKLLDEKSVGLRAELDALKESLSNTKAQIQTLQKSGKDALQAREELRDQAISQAGPESAQELALKLKETKLLGELLAAIKSGSISDVFDTEDVDAIEDPAERADAIWKEEKLQNYAYLKDAKGADLDEAYADLEAESKEARDSLRSLREKIVGQAEAEVRKGLRQLKQKIEEIRKQQQQFTELLRKQEDAVDTKREELKSKIEPLQQKLEQHLKNHNSNKELGLLQNVRNFLQDRDDLVRGDGSYAVENMFELPSKDDVKGPGYSPPRSLKPGEESVEWGPGVEKDTRKPYQPAPEKFAPKPKAEPAPIESKPDSTRIKPPSGKADKVTSDLSADEIADMRDKVRFKPQGTELSTNTERTLAEELQSVSLHLDPEESKKAWQKRVENFGLLLSALRKHFAAGKSIHDFKPGFSETQTLPDQNEVIRSIAEFLIDNGEDIKVSPEVWDLTNMNRVSIVKPVEILKKTLDLSSNDSAVESLLNAQPSLGNKEAAKTLHDIIRVMLRGKTMPEILKGLKASKSEDASSALSLAKRLAFFLSLHSDLKTENGKWNLVSLYDGSHKFPTTKEFDNTKPLEQQMTPFIRSLQEQMQEEAGTEGGIEPVSATEQRVLDMLVRMSDLAESGKDLDAMGEEFSALDKKNAKPYSLTYLFQQMKNYLNRLNRTKGLANMRDNYGLDKVFGEGAPPASPTQQDEIKPATEKQKEEISPAAGERTPSFEVMVKALGLNRSEAETAYKIMVSVQLHMEEGRTAASIFQALLDKRPAYTPLVKKILVHLGKNRAEFDSGVPGHPDFSSLTGIEFSHPAQAKEAPVEAVPSLQEILEAKPPVPEEAERKELRSTIFDEMAKEYELDDDQKNMFADAVRVLKSISLEQASAKTQDTVLQNVVEIIAEFFLEKGLVNADHLPDFRGVSIPPLGGRESYFAKDGTPNLKAVEENEPDFNADELAADMPEPASVSEEEEEELTDTLRGRGKTFSPELQQAVDFLTSDEVTPDDEEEPAQRDTAKARLQRNIWNMMSTEFELDAEDSSTALSLLRTVQKSGLQKVRAPLKGPAAVLFDDLIQYMHENGLQDADIPGIQLPEPTAAEPKSVPKEEKKPKGPPPTIRKKVDQAVVVQVLDAVKANETKSGFNVADVVQGLEGKVSPDAAKNALLQAADAGYISLQVKKDIQAEDLAFVPVAKDGSILALGKILRMPAPVAAPAPAVAPAPSEQKPRGRLPKELGNIQVTEEILDYVTRQAGLTPEELLTLNGELETGLKGLTYSEVAKAIKSKDLSSTAKQGFIKYLQGLANYLRQVQAGQDPLGAIAPPVAAPARPKGEWRSDPATEKQTAKVQELEAELKKLGRPKVTDLGAPPWTKGEASDAINALKKALEEAPPAPPSKPSRLENLKGLLTQDKDDSIRRLKRVRAIVSLRAYTPEELKTVIEALPLPPKEKQRLLDEVPFVEETVDAPKPPTAAPAVSAPATPVTPRPKPDKAALHALYEKAIEFCTKNNSPSALAFKLLLQKKRPDLLSLYETIMPRVQTALDAINSEDLDIDLSGI